MKTIITILLIIAVNLSHAASVADFLSDADGYIQKRDYKAAIIQLKNALQQEPKNVDARLKLGGVYLKVGNGPSAEKEYRKAKKHGAAVEQWMPNLAEAMLIQGRSADVIRDIVVKKDLPADVKAKILGIRGQAYIMRKDVKSATGSFEEALKLDKNNTFALIGSARILASLGKFEKATHQVDYALTISANNIVALTLRADLARQAGNLVLAKNTYKKALAVYSRHIPALDGMSSTFLTLKEFAEASKFADKIIAINKELPRPYYIKALVELNNKNAKTAETHLQKVLNLAPHHLPSLLIMGNIQYSKGNYEQAEKYLREYNNKFPRHLPAIKLLAGTRLKLKDVEGAKKILHAGEAVDENDVDILSMLGMVYSQSGELSKGSEYIERAAKISPNKANIQTQLGLSYLAGGELDQAVSTLENAIKLDEDFERADIMLILAHLRKKDYDKTLEAAKEFAKKQPNNPIPYNFQGGAYAALGKTIKARQAFEKALQIKPDYSVAEFNLARLDIQEKKFNSAEKHFKNVIKNDDKNIKAYLDLAKILLEQGKNKESLGWVKKISQKQPGAIQPAIVLNRFYVADKQFAKALDVAENIVSQHPKSIVALDMLARSQSVNDKIKAAVKTYESIVDLQPENSNAHYQLALAYLRNKNEKLSKKHLDKTLRLDSYHIGALSTYVKLDASEKKYQSALARASKLKDKYSNQAIGWVMEGDVFVAQKKYSKAIQAYELALKKQENNKVVYRLARAYEANKDRNGSVNTLKNWLVKHKDDAAGHILLAQVYQNLKNNEDSAREYEIALSLNPSNLVALNNVAWIYVEMNNLKAIEYSKKAYDLSANNPEIADTYGWALTKLGDKQKGLNILQQASMQAPHLDEIRYHLSIALERNGKTDESRKELERLKKKGFVFPEK